MHIPLCIRELQNFIGQRRQRKRKSIDAETNPPKKNTQETWVHQGQYFKILILLVRWKHKVLYIKIELHLAFSIHLDVPLCDDHTYACSGSNMEFERLATVNHVSENQTYIAVTTEENLPSNFQLN